MNLRQIRRWLLITAAVVLGLLLVLTLGLKMVLDRAPQYQSQIKSWVHEQTGFYIRFAHVYPSLRWYGPELYFDQLELRSKDDLTTVAVARGGSVAVDVWQLILSARLRAGRIRLEAPQLQVVRIGPNRFRLAAGLEFGSSGGSLTDTLRRLPRGRLVVRDADVTLRQWNAALPELKFGKLDFDLWRTGERADLELSMDMPAQLQGSVRLRLGASGFDGNEGLLWSVRLRARDVSLPGWHELLPEFSNTLTAGVARIDLSAAGGGNFLQSSAEFTANDIAIVRAGTGAGAAPLALREVGGEFEFARDQDRWRLSGKRVRAFAAGQAARETRFSINWRAPAGLLADLDAQVDYLGFAALAPIVAVLPQKELRDRIDAYDLSGEWFDTRLRYSRANADATPRWSASARFSGAGFAPMGRAPGFAALSGSVRGDERSGQLQISSPGARMLWPQEWPAAITLDTLQGSVFWKRMTDGVLLASQNLQTSNKDFHATTKFALQRFDTDRAAEITLASKVTDVDATAAPRYLPRQRIAPTALSWLNRAFVSGRVPQADLVLRGPLRNYPFRDGSGLFLVRFPVENLTLDYREGWPRIRDISLDAQFHNQGLTVWVTHASAGEVVVQHATGTFEDFKTGELKIHADAHTDAAAAIGFLAATPLDVMAEHAFSKVDAAGPLDARIDLFLPFKEFDQRRVLVAAQLDGVSLAYKGSKAAATQLRGSVSVDGAQVPQAQLRGVALGGPLQVRARAPRNKSDLATQLELRGTLTADGVRAAFDLPADVIPSGHADWRGTVRLSPAPARERWVRMTSNLAGLAITLPQPFNKPAEAPLPFFAQMEWPKTGAPLIRVNVTPLVRGILELDSNDDTLRWSRAAIQFGGESPVLSSSDPLVVAGHVGRLDLSGWLRRQGAASAPASASPFDRLQTASLQVDELRVQGLAFRDVGLRLTAADRAWQVDVEGPDAQGTLRFPRGAQTADPWELKFSHLKIGGAGNDDAGNDETGPAQPSVASPRSVPALHLQSDQLFWHDRSIGSIDAVLSKREDGIALDQLHVHSPSFNLQAEGSWRGPEGGKGALDGVLVSNDVQKTLTQFGYADVMQAKAGRLDFELSWLGAPSVQAVATLNGHVKLEADKGQIVDLHPGAGRVLGLASVATLPRRLFLDFSDLTDKGLAFDTIRGDFDVRDGDAYTTNVLLDGPAAEIGLIGRVGLAKQDLDQTAVVAGNFGNSLPLASTLAAGPVVGAAVLVFTQVFKQPLKGLARGYYRITGSWENPLVERVKSDEAAAATRRESKPTQK